MQSTVECSTVPFLKGSTMKITIQLRNVYGTYKAYPVCDRAKAFARIAKTSTLTPDTLKDIDALGYTFESVHPILKAEMLTFEELNRVMYAQYQ